jgi:HAD superfamily hydrolase (TIGR01484 family)
VKPLAKLPKRGIKAIFFDIDDTLTTHGKLTAMAYKALWRAQEAGMITVPVTGRPAGWCDHIARMWPVHGVVGENGAFAMYHDGRVLRRLDVLDEKTRQQNRRRLDALAVRILQKVPGSALASDQGYRDYDLAIDFCEDVPPLPRERIDAIVHEFVAAGATAMISSIHVNGWFGKYDKLSMATRFMREILGLDAAAGFPQCVFVGDSPNDQPMFAAFSRSVGVKNVLDFEDRLRSPPAYVSARRCGAGFAEVISTLLS